MNIERVSGRNWMRVTGRRLIAVAAAGLLAGSLVVATTTAASAKAPGRVTSAGAVAIHAVSQTELGPNVLVFDPSMPQAQIQTAVDAIANEQLTNQFGTQRYALLFKPGTYGSATDPLNFQVGYYTEVAGLGLNPDDVVINGSINVYNQCDATHNCIALNNFWRSLSNLSINVTDPAGAACYAGEFWAVSQAAPMRRVHVTGKFTLMDYCTNPSYASGGFIADSRIDGPAVVNGTQQQFVVRNSTVDAWGGGVWNQVFAGVVNAPAQCFPGQPAPGCGGPYTTLAATPVSREKPYLYVDSKGAYRVFVPRAATNSTGESWATASTPGHSLPLSAFYVATAADSVATLNRQLSRGRNLLLTPGVYDVDSTIAINRADTVVLGLGLATLTAVDGAVPVAVGNVPGVDVAGLVIDAGSQNSPALMRIGTVAGRSSGRAGDPTAVQDVFFRIGGPHAGRATVSLQVNSNHVVLDDIWAWRADHGTGVGWTENTAASGVVVNGDHVDAVGLFVEHYQKYQVIWNGNHGSDIFFQSEMPYDVPSQAAWMPNRATDGYAAFKVSPAVRTFTGYGMGVYSFFNQKDVNIYAARAFEVPTRNGVALHDLLTIFLDANNGQGGILEVVNSTGGPSTVTNPDTPVTVVDYP